MSKQKTVFTVTITGGTDQHFTAKAQALRAFLETLEAHCHEADTAINLQAMRYKDGAAHYTVLAAKYLYQTDGKVFPDYFRA